VDSIATDGDMMGRKRRKKKKKKLNNIVTKKFNTHKLFHIEYTYITKPGINDSG
jgi:hypothetical protein